MKIKIICNLILTILCMAIFILCTVMVYDSFNNSKSYEFAETKQIPITDEYFFFDETNQNKSLTKKVSTKEHTTNIGVMTKSNLKAEQLEKGLLKELKQYSQSFIDAEAETGINAVFLASVAALESGWGTSSVSLNNNNLFGWAKECGSYSDFKSIPHCVEYVSLSIKENYLSSNGVYFSGYEVEDINKFYNGKEEWKTAINEIMQQINKRIKEV